MTIQQPTTKQGAKGCMMGANDCLLTHLSDDGCFFLSLFMVYIQKGGFSMFKSILFTHTGRIYVYLTTEYICK